MKIINRVIFTFNLISIIALLGAYLAPYISPESLWQIAFLGIAFPFVFILNFLFVIYWIFQLDLRLLFSLCALILGYPQLKNHIQFSAIKTEKKKSDLTVLSFNAHSFGLFDDRKYNLHPFYNLVKEIDADVMCFQEFNSSGLPEESLVSGKTFIKNNITQYKYFINDELLPFTGYSLCIYSKYPIVKSGFAERINRFDNVSIYADIIFHSDTIRVINTHLKSIAFDEKDYDTYEKVDGPGQIHWYEFGRMVLKLKNGFIKRSKQVNVLREKINESPYPVILCGDFNDTPNSYAYKALKGDLNDAFVKAGSGLSRTYVGRMPSFRIDYIFGDKKYFISNYKPYQLKFSDHRLITATFQTSE